MLVAVTVALVTGGISSVFATHAREVFVNVPGFSEVAAVNARWPTPRPTLEVDAADFVRTPAEYVDGYPDTESPAFVKSHAHAANANQSFEATVPDAGGSALPVELLAAAGMTMSVDTLETLCVPVVTATMTTE
jgi:hypothetical protein